jgi:hypothetical protein
MPLDIRAQLQECGGFSGALETVCAGFTAVGYIHCRSTSTGVFNATTGERYGLSDGEHIYLLVQDGATRNSSVRRDMTKTPGSFLSRLAPLSLPYLQTRRGTMHSPPWHFLTLLEEFPFADGQGANESTMLSAIVSAIMRAALGNVPLHAFNTPQARSGKSLAATLVSIIAQGRLPALCTAGKNEEELEKRIDAMLLWSPPFFVIDNINYPLESASQCVLLTQEEKRIRPLGTSDFPEVKSRPFVECTGNNLALVGDLAGRSIRCTIDAKCERPEFRPIKVPLA